MLEATVAHLHFTQGPLDDDAGEGGAAYGGADGHQGANQQNTASGPLTGFSQTARKVYEYLLNTPQTNEGLHAQEIASNLMLDYADVTKAGDDLIEGGVIYTTVNEDTWAILEME